MRKTVLTLLFLLVSVSIVSGLGFDCQDRVGYNCFEPPEPTEDMLNLSNDTSTVIAENETVNNSEMDRQNGDVEKGFLNSFLKRFQILF
jgi:hypothetical protein